MQLKITGGKKHLKGTVFVPGDKVVATHILYFSLLSSSDILINNFPFTSEINKILDQVKINSFADIEKINETTLSIKNQNNEISDITDLSFNRSSICLVTGLTYRANKTLFKNVGGCNFTERPIDGHIKLIEAFGNKVNSNDDYFSALKVRNIDSNFVYDCSINGSTSVGITFHALLASINMKFKSIQLKNIALEPTIYALVNIIEKYYDYNICFDKAFRSISMINDSKSENNITKELNITLEPDFTYLTTFLGIGINCKKLNLCFHPINNIPDWLKSLFAESNISWKLSNNKLYTKSDSIIPITNIICKPFPGFPSDIGPILFSAFLNYQKDLVLVDKVYERRSSHIPELAKFGFWVNSKGNTTYKSNIKNNDIDKSDFVTAKDIRCGASLIVAAVGKDGVSYINNFEEVLRGYCFLKHNFNNLEIKYSVDV